jgi:hypothetical protein
MVDFRNFTSLYLYINKYTCICIYIYIYVCVCEYTYICIHINLCVCMYIHTCIHKTCTDINVHSTKPVPTTLPFHPLSLWCLMGAFCFHVDGRCTEKLDPSSIVLLDNGFELYLHITRAPDPQQLMDLFGRGTVEECVNLFRSTCTFHFACR